jgi:hypothetical protein
MPVPTLTVEVAFASDPLTASPSWTDITAYVRDSPGVSISRGRTNEVSTFGAGQLSLTLDNRDRRFDPLHTSGPYYGQLLPRKQIRVRATWSATSYDLFRGFVVGWPTKHPRVGRDSVVDLVAIDGLALLNDMLMPDQVFRYADTTIGSLFAFFRSAGADGWLDAKGGRVLSLSSGTAQFTDSDLALSTELSRPVVFSSGTAWSLPVTVDIRPGFSTPFSYSFWLQTTGAGASSSNWMAILGDGGKQRIGIDNLGLVQYEGSAWTAGFIPSAQSTLAVNDGQPHHVVVVHDGTLIRIYIDGVDRTGFYTAPPSSCNIRHVGRPNPTSVDTYFVGTLQDVAFFTKALSATEAQGLYGASVGVVQQSSATRVGFVLDSVGWPASWRSLTSTGVGVCGTLQTAGQSALTELQLAAATEQGRMFVDRSGNVALQGRFWSSTDVRGSTTQVTFADDGTGVSFQGFGGFDAGDREVVNDVTVSGAAGAQRSSDAASITAHGQRAVSVQTEVPDLEQARSIAAGIVYLRKTPRSRAMPVSVSLTDTSSFASLLSLEVGDRVAVKITPMSVGSAITQTLHVEQVNWSISLSEWVVEVGGPPTPPAGWFILGTSSLGGSDVLGF